MQHRQTQKRKPVFHLIPLLRVGILLLLMSLTGCNASQGQVIYVTATFDPAGSVASMGTEAIAVVDGLEPGSGDDAAAGSGEVPPAAENNSNVADFPREHTVQAGETLYAIALAYNTSMDTLVELNQLENPDILAIGQIIKLPPAPNEQTPAARLMSDAALIRGPNSASFDVAGFVAGQPGFIRVASDLVNTNRADGLGLKEILSAAEVVARVSLEFSVDPRLLLALLEYRAGWLSNPDPAAELKTHPMISEEASGAIDRAGLYRQLAWTANELNRGYYGAKYDGLRVIEFDSGESLALAPELNPATVGILHQLHLANTPAKWQLDISENGFVAVYRRYFGDPLTDQTDPLAGMGAQPELTLPFSAGETWFFTGGAHGGWGNGSAWSAIDFAPPDERDGGPLCYTSDWMARAVAPGIIARSERGVVVLDLDGDGDETTGWTILYLHLASDDRVTSGTVVQTGDPIGKPACEGGFSTATHLHIARRYNGEWLPVTCFACDAGLSVAPYVLSGWTVYGLRYQEYQGYMLKGGERRTAEQGRTNPINRVSW